MFRSLKHAVSRGLAHRGLEGVIQYQRRHKYLTLVYQTDVNCRRLLWAGKEPTKKSSLQFFRIFGKQRSGQLRFVCSDMWRPYLTVIGEKAGQAIQALDRFHIMAKMNKAIDKAPAAEVKRLERDGYEPVLKHSRWCPAEVEREPHGKASGEVTELASVQLAVGPQSSDA